MLARLRLSFLVLSCLFAALPRAHAQDDQYEQTVRRALAEYEAGNWEEARASFRQAHGLNPNARTWRGMGISAFELRQYVNTIHELEAALADGRKPLTQDQRADAQRLISQARDYVSVYRLKVSPAEAQILVDGAPATAKDGKLYVDPGSHTLTFRAASHVERRLDVRLDAGTQQELVVELSPTPKPGQPVAQPGQAPPPKKPRVWTWVLGGATVASAIVAGGLAYGVHRHVNTNDECVAAGYDCAGVVAEGKNLQLGTNIMLGVTAALAIGTVVAIVVESKNRGEEPPTQTSLFVRPDGVGFRSTF